MTRPVLTRAEQDVFDILRADLSAGQPAPTYQAIAERLGMTSKGAIADVVQRLDAKGYITRRKAATRSITLAPPPDSVTIRLGPDLAARLEAHIGPWAATPDDVIAKALTEYLGRHA